MCARESKVPAQLRMCTHSNAVAMKMGIYLGMRFVFFSSRDRDASLFVIFSNRIFHVCQKAPLAFPWHRIPIPTLNAFAFQTNT